MENFLRPAVELLLPRHCVVCGGELGPDEQDICLHCTLDLPLTRFENWARNPMADRFNELINPYIPEGTAEPYAYACALFYYVCEYQHITPALKYGRDLRAGRNFARMLGAKLSASALYSDVDCIIPVPLHPLRAWRRGYNQAEVIAREIAAFFPQAKLEKRLLRRCRYTRSQTKMNAESKMANVEGAFRAQGNPPAGVKHLLLVDDVFTSGSTMAACWQALRTLFPPPVRISLASIAFVENV